MSDASLAALRRLVAAQAEDPGLWFVAQTASEAYLQQELRRLHELIEGTSSLYPGVDCDNTKRRGAADTAPAMAQRRRNLP